jgi:pimeloyl-ACP methyl ester carboxylesterase
MMLRRTGLLLLVSAAVFAPFARAQAPAGDKFFDSRGVKIRYVDVGRGEPVVLIHGFSSSLDANWGQTRVIDALAKYFRVVALDCRGHGKSDKPHDAASYGLAMIDDVARRLDHLGIAKAHTAVFGGSAPRLRWNAHSAVSVSSAFNAVIRCLTGQRLYARRRLRASADTLA